MAQVPRSGSGSAIWCNSPLCQQVAKILASHRALVGLPLLHSFCGLSLSILPLPSLYSAVVPECGYPGADVCCCLRTQPP